MFFYIWAFALIFITIFLMSKMYPHVKNNYEHHFWLGFWIYNSSGLDDEGKKIRKKLLIIMGIFMLVGLAILRS